VFEHEGMLSHPALKRHDGAQFESGSTARRAPTVTGKDYATEAAVLIKSKKPHSRVEVKDMKSGEVTAVALQTAVQV
jgi:hypothetical protein